MKLLVIGHAQHGKDTVAAILAECGFKFTSSSEAACKIFLYKALKDIYGYKNITECFEDRVNHRALWYQLICEYNKEDPSRLARGILEHSNIYVGMRDRREIDACIRKGLFDLIIWVERDFPLEDSSSFNIDKSMADIIIDNKGTLEDLNRKVKRLASCLMNEEEDSSYITESILSTSEGEASSDWDENPDDYWLSNPPAKPSHSIELEFRYAGRSRPIPYWPD